MAGPQQARHNHRGLAQASPPTNLWVKLRACHRSPRRSALAGALGLPATRQRFGVLQPSGAFRRPGDVRKRRRTGAVQNASRWRGCWGFLPRGSVLECSSPLELSVGLGSCESAGGPAQSKTLRAGEGGGGFREVGWALLLPRFQGVFDASGRCSLGDFWLYCGLCLLHALFTVSL